jgi:prevent-host-death family protein
MEVVNYSNLRDNLKKILDSVVEDETQYVINRGKESAVLIFAITLCPSVSLSLQPF